MGAYPGLVLEKIERMKFELCPFCGTRAGLNYRDHEGYYMTCGNDNCCAMGPRDKVPEKAIEKWNKGAKGLWGYLKEMAPDSLEIKVS